MAALLAMGNSPHTIKTAGRSSSACPEKTEIFDSRLEKSPFTGIPNIE